MRVLALLSFHTQNGSTAVRVIETQHRWDKPGTTNPEEAATSEDIQLNISNKAGIITQQASR